MMDQKNWETLAKAFQEEEPWWGGRYADESDFEELNLFDWLECDNSPSWKMRDEFDAHGYGVLCLERDSFSWLIGGVIDRKTGKVITFG